MESNSIHGQSESFIFFIDQKIFEIDTEIVVSYDSIFFNLLVSLQAVNIQKNSSLCLSGNVNLIS